VKVDEYTSKGWWSDETIDQVFRAQVRVRGDELAVVDPANRSELSGGDPRRLSWNQLESEVIALAAGFSEVGLGRGDVLGVQMPNTVELVEVYLAAWSLGI
ncbi:AMP-binding protein, partial [Staphylococcus aureus]